LQKAENHPEPRHSRRLLRREAVRLIFDGDFPNEPFVP
jgi:hypothetical protein